MDKFKKLIFPALVLLVIGVIYSVYFAPGGELGDFSLFDPNNNATKQIRVKIVRDKGVEKDPVNGVSIFHVVDKKGTEVTVEGPINLPPYFETNDVITITGHMHSGYFHATEIRD